MDYAHSFNRPIENRLRYPPYKFQVKQNARQEKMKWQ